MKTIDDVTRDEWADLAEATVELLAVARMMYWVGEHEESDDPSYRNALEQAERALRNIGLDQGTTPEFSVRLEEILRAGPAESSREQRKQAVAEAWMKEKGPVQ